MLDPKEQGPFPVDCTCYWRVIFVQWWVVQVLNKEFINYVDLKSEQRYSVSGTLRHVSQERMNLRFEVSLKQRTLERQKPNEIQNHVLGYLSFTIFSYTPAVFFFVLQIALLLQTMYNHFSDLLDILKSVLGMTSGQACIVRACVPAHLRTCMHAHTHH